jgi:hypothetical protein
MVMLLIKKLKDLNFATLVTYLVAIGFWQCLFYKNSVLSIVLWEIHTVFSSVLLFFVLMNYALKTQLFDIIKIIFRILIKVWFVIFIAFSMHKNLFDVKGFILTATFIFGYLEGLIDLNSWLKSPSTAFIFNYFQTSNSHKSRLILCILGISWIHIFSALIAYLYFSIL